MSEVLVKLQKNIFLMTVISAVFLGISIAYVGSVASAYMFVPSDLSVVAPPEPQRRSSSGPSFNADDYNMIPAGAFFRGAVVADDGSLAAAAAETRVILIKGVLSGSWRYARALIQVDGEERAVVVKLGETVGGYKLVAVHGPLNRRRGGVTVEAGGQRIRIDVGQKSEEAVQQAQQAQAEQATESGSDGQVVARTVQRSALIQAMQSGDLMTKIRGMPFRRGDDGPILGFRILEPGPLADLGIQQLDIIRRINGQDLRDNTRMLQLLGQIQTLNEVVVDLERGGKQFTYKIAIQ